MAFSNAGRITLACRPTAVRRAWRDLIENAVRYGERCRVRLEGGCDAARIVIFLDEGPGIPEAECERLCEPFVPLGGALARNRRHRAGPWPARSCARMAARPAQQPAERRPRRHPHPGPR